MPQPTLHRSRRRFSMPSPALSSVSSAPSTQPATPPRRQRRQRPHQRRGPHHAAGHGQRRFPDRRSFTDGTSNRQTGHGDDVGTTSSHRPHRANVATTTPRLGTLAGHRHARVGRQVRRPPSRWPARRPGGRTRDRAHRAGVSAHTVPPLGRVRTFALSPIAPAL